MYLSKYIKYKKKYLEIKQKLIQKGGKFTCENNEVCKDDINGKYNYYEDCYNDCIKKSKKKKNK